MRDLAKIHISSRRTAKTSVTASTGPLCFLYQGDEKHADASTKRRKKDIWAMPTRLAHQSKSESIWVTREQPKPALLLVLDHSIIFSVTITIRVARSIDNTTFVVKLMLWPSNAVPCLMLIDNLGDWWESWQTLAQSKSESISVPGEQLILIAALLGRVISNKKHMIQMLMAWMSHAVSFLLMILLMRETFHFILIVLYQDLSKWKKNQLSTCHPCPGCWCSGSMSMSNLPIAIVRFENCSSLHYS